MSSEKTLPLGNDPDFGFDEPEDDHDDADESKNDKINERYGSNNG